MLCKLLCLYVCINFRDVVVTLQTLATGATTSDRSLQQVHGCAQRGELWLCARDYAYVAHLDCFLPQVYVERKTSHKHIYLNILQQLKVSLHSSLIQNRIARPQPCIMHTPLAETGTKLEPKCFHSAISLT